MVETHATSSLHEIVNLKRSQNLSDLQSQHKCSSQEKDYGKLSIPTPQNVLLSYFSCSSIGKSAEFIKKYETRLKDVESKIPELVQQLF